MSESLRDTIANAYDEVTASETPQPEGVKDAVIPGPEATPQAKPETAPVETKPSRTEGRPRDAQGRLLPGKPEKPESVQAEPAVSAAVRPPRPSSWKKDYWDHWEKLDPKLAEYINQRENEYARGVSTYKTEWDQVKPIAEAMAQFEPDLKANNIRPEQWITSLGTAHRMLATGTPEAKASMFLKLAQDYQVPLESLFVQGQDGKLYFNPNVRPFQAQAPQPQMPDFDKLLDQKLLERSTAQEIQSFATATDDKGQLKHPHFEVLRTTMQRLLSAELATDINDAYTKAIPYHPEIHAQIQEQETKAEIERKAQEQAAAVARARTKAISPRGSAPSVAGETKPKGVRAAVEAAVEQHMGGGRV